jgi:RNA polymerase sigma factor (sigma-70 family)
VSGQAVRRVFSSSREEGRSDSEFEVFFRRTYSELVRSLYLLTADLREAEELAQATMAQVYERWDRVSTMRSPVGYLYRTAINLNRKRLRHLAVRARRALLLGHRGHLAPEGEMRTELDEALNSLPARQRETFLLVEWIGLTVSEAAQQLGIQPSSVRSHVHRARAKLREHLGPEDRGSA